MDEGHTVDVIYLDFAKAFDSVNQRFLLAKMKSFGLRDVVVRWIEAYLSGRVSAVSEYEPSQFSYCCMGLVEEMGPTDQSN